MASSAPSPPSISAIRAQSSTLNLLPLQRIDAQIQAVVLTAKHTVLYTLDQHTETWVPPHTPHTHHPHYSHCTTLHPLPSLTPPPPPLPYCAWQEREEVEGPFFLVERSSPPYYAMAILNRRSIDNFLQEIAPDMTFEIQDKCDRTHHAPLTTPSQPALLCAIMLPCSTHSAVSAAWRWWGALLSYLFFQVRDDVIGVWFYEQPEVVQATAALNKYLIHSPLPPLPLTNLSLAPSPHPSHPLPSLPLPSSAGS